MHDFELYGFSLFETMLARRGKIPQLEAHWQRMCRSASQLAMTPPDLSTFRQHATQQLATDCNQVVRLSLMRHGGRWQAHTAIEDRIHVAVKTQTNQQPNALSLTIAKQSVAVGDHLRWHKTGNRLLYQMQAQQAQAAGLNDCLHHDHDRTVLETTNCNLLLLRDNTWLTPSYDSCILPGIMRQNLLATKLVKEAHLKLEDLTQMRALAVCNAVWGVIPVKRLDDRHFDTAAVQTLQARAKALLHKED